MRSAILELRLTDFRCYAQARLDLGGRSVFLHGPNGAGKTNLLEAVSLLSPGRGLRGAAMTEIGRREPNAPLGAAWAVAARLAWDDTEATIGVGVETRGSSRRQVRIDGETAAPGALSRRIRPLWLTPAQDRLFLEGASDRRRFFDRLVFADDPAHAQRAAVYERALRERGRLLAEDRPDPAWLAAVEAQAAQSGAALAAARARTLSVLCEEIATREASPFPRAGLALTGEWEKAAQTGEPEADIADRLGRALAAGRPRDRAAGRALTGPHRGDLAAWRLETGRPAADCSTGEQKALILNLLLAQAARLSRDDTAPRPVLLLDEVAAHLDPNRRAALFDEIEALSLQAFLTGTEEALFAPFADRALGVRVDAARLTLPDA